MLKSEGSPKPEIRNQSFPERSLQAALASEGQRRLKRAEARAPLFGLRISDFFRISTFGFRIFGSGGHQFYAFHCDRTGGAASGAKAAADAAGLVLDDRALLAARGHAPVTREERALQLFIAAQVGGVHQPQAVFGADIGATATENAFVAVKHRADVALQAAIRLPPRIGFGIIFFHFGNP